MEVDDFRVVGQLLHHIERFFDCVANNKVNDYEYS